MGIREDQDRIVVETTSCRICKAAPGEPCRTWDGTLTRRPHGDRRLDARRDPVVTRRCAQLVTEVL